MTTRQSRLGNVTDHAARTLELIDQLEAAGPATPALMCALLRHVILDLDQVGLHREVIRAGDLIGGAVRRLEDKPDGEDPEDRRRQEVYERYAREHGVRL